MKFTKADKVSFIRRVVSDHENWWSERQADMRRYKAAYMTDFYRDRESLSGGSLSNRANEIRVETSDAYAYIEGYIASLFSKAPAVEVGADIGGAGDHKVAKQISNDFLYDQKTQFELASRLALIYPNSFIKLYPRESTQLLDRVGIKAVVPWEVIVDRDSSSWSEQRYVGHIYWETVARMNEKFGAREWIGVQKEDYFQQSATSNNNNKRSGGTEDLPKQFMYCKVIELYDFVTGELYFWTPNQRSTDKLLSSEAIPLEGEDGRPCAPISPLYYTRVPDKPLDGMSSMKRIYDQVYEKNILRSFWAGAVRRDSRQFLVKEGAIDNESLAKITAGIDGAMISVDAESLEGLILAVPNTPINSNHTQYLAQVDADLAKGSVLAPFTRGETTKATATEINALAHYSSSEIGRLARERDAMIEDVSDKYVRIIALIVEEDERQVILVDGKPETVTIEKLSGKFKYSALDQASTPVSDAMRKEQMVALVPVLKEVGVDPKKIRSELIRMFDLPKSFDDDPEQAAPEAAPALPAMPTTPGPAIDPATGQPILQEL